MAIDVYLYMSGIKGESSDSVHKDWIECTSVTWGLIQPKSVSGSTAGGHTAERCEHFELVFTKLTDKSTPILLQNCSAGLTIPNARLEFMRADGAGRRIKYFEVALENVLVGTVMPSVREGEVLTEQVGLKYAKVNWKYVQQKVSGGACGNTAGGWDLSANKIC